MPKKSEINHVLICCTILFVSSGPLALAKANELRGPASFKDNCRKLLTNLLDKVNRNTYLDPRPILENYVDYDLPKVPPEKIHQFYDPETPIKENIELPSKVEGELFIGELGEELPKNSPITLRSNGNYSKGVEIQGSSFSRNSRVSRRYEFKYSKGADDFIKNKSLRKDIPELYKERIKSALDQTTSTLLRDIENGDELAKRQFQLVNEVIDTGVLYAKKLKPAEIESFKHQRDLIDALLENPKLLNKLQNKGFDLSSYIRGTIDSDMGKQSIYKELLTISSPKSDMLFDFLKGAGPMESSKVLTEILQDMGYPLGKTILNARVSNDTLRNIIKENPILTGYLHEYPGMSEAILAFEKKIITRNQFKRQIQANLFHNGPSAGFWNLLENSFIPGSFKSKGNQDDIAKIFGNTIYDSTDGESPVLAPKYGSPFTFESFVGTFFDRMSQGTRGGYLKIGREKESFTEPMENIRDLLIEFNPQGTLSQLDVLKKGALNSKRLLPEQKEILVDIINQGIERLTKFKEFASKHFKMPTDENGKIIQPVQKLEITNPDTNERNIFEIEKDMEGKSVGYKYSRFNKFGEHEISSHFDAEYSGHMIRELANDVLKTEEVLFGDPLTSFK